jgi:hypothetical protein
VFLGLLQRAAVSSPTLASNPGNEDANPCSGRMYDSLRISLSLASNPLSNTDKFLVWASVQLFSTLRVSLASEPGRLKDSS